MILYPRRLSYPRFVSQEAQRKASLAVTLLENIGFTVNREKSCLSPTQAINFLGLVISSTAETLSLPEDKVLKFKCPCPEAISTPTMSACQMISLRGALESCHLAIWLAPLHFRYISGCVNYVGPQSLGWTQMVVVEHGFGEWQSNHTSNPHLLHNDRCIQDRMEGGVPRASHKRALVGRRKQTSCKRIRTQGHLLGPKVLTWPAWEWTTPQQ